MSEKKEVSRRSYIKYGAAAVVVVAAGAGGAYYYSTLPPPTPPPPTTTAAVTTTAMPPPTSAVATTMASSSVSGLHPATGPFYLGGNAYLQPFTDFDFKGTSITGVVDSGLNYIPFVDPDEGYPNSVTSGPHFGQNQVPKFQDATGITVTMDAVDAGDTYSLYMTDLVSGTGKWNIIVYFSTYNGDIMGGGYTYPIDDLVAKYNVDTSLMPPFIKQLYCSYAGHLMALPYDGDFHAYYYRKDIFSNPDIMSKFKAKYGYDLAPAQTWKQYNDIGEFFTGWDWAGDGKPHYGLVEDIKDLGHEQWMQRFASWQGVYFDENMNPQVNTPAGISAATDLLTAITKYAPPGDTSLAWEEVISTFCNGTVPQMVAWPDIGPRGGTGNYSVKGDQIGTTLPPGGATVNGNLVRRSLVSPGRVMVISKYTPPEKVEAVFLLMKWMYEVGPIYVPTGLNGEDPPDDACDAPGSLPYWSASNTAWSAAGIQDYIAGAKTCLANGYPDIYLPGQAQYVDSLDRHLGEMLAGKSTPTEAMSSVNDDWVGITKDIGLPKQQALWKEVVAAYKALGLWPS